MKNDWEKQLRDWPAPEPNEPSRDQALEAAQAALNEPARESVEIPAWTWPLPWRVATGALAAISLGTILFFRPPSKPAEVTTSASDQRLLAEMESLFPGRVNAVIARNDHVDLSLADEAGRHSDQVIVIEFTGHGETLRVIGYSGRALRVPLKTRSLTFEPLSTAAGGVLLVGDNFLWEASRPSQPDGYRIIARALPPSA